MGFRAYCSGITRAFGLFAAKFWVEADVSSFKPRAECWGRNIIALMPEHNDALVIDTPYTLNPSPSYHSIPQSRPASAVVGPWSALTLNNLHFLVYCYGFLI